MSVLSSSSSKFRLALACTALLSAGCMSNTHVVGMGATGSGTIVARQYYWFFGFFQVNEVDVQHFVPDLTSYTVQTEYGFVDMILAPLLLPFMATSRTVVVRT